MDKIHLYNFILIKGNQEFEKSVHINNQSSLVDVK